MALGTGTHERFERNAAVDPPSERSFAWVFTAFFAAHRSRSFPAILRIRLRRDPGAASYWIERDPPGPKPESMVEQF